MGIDPTLWPDSWLQTASPSVSAADYQTFVQALQVVGVRFAKASVHAPTIYTHNPARRLVSTTTRDARYLNLTQGFAATLVFQFRGWWEDDPTSGVTAEAEVEVLYRSSVLMTEEMFRPFKDGHLPGHASPYLREFLHSALGRTGWPIYTLPMFARTSGAPNPIGSHGGLQE